MAFLNGIGWSQWPQTEFMIGTLQDPEMTGTPSTDRAAYTKVKNANFNLLTGNYCRGLGGGAGGGWKTFNTRTPVPGIPGGVDVSNSYKLAQVAAVGGLKMMIQDEDVANFVKTAATAVAQYKSLPTASVAAIAGYNWESEPKSYEVPIHLGLLHDYNTADPKNIAYFDLAANVPDNGSTTWADWSNHIDNYLAEPTVRILSFDYYPFDTGPSSKNGFSQLGMDNILEVNYFRHIGVMASKVKALRAAGRTVNYWGIATATEHHSAYFDHPYQTLERLQYEAFTLIAYGSKAVLWFTYELPDLLGYYTSPTRSTNGGDHDLLYTNLKNVNLALKNMGPTLMDLNWIATIHGATVTDPVTHEGTDPVSQEPHLPTLLSVGSGQTVVSSGQTIPDQFQIGIFNNAKNGDNYLIVHNKSLTTASSITFKVNGIVTIKRHNKTTDSWETVPSAIQSYAKTTEIKLNLSAANGELIWLDHRRLPPSVRLPLR